MNLWLMIKLVLGFQVCFSMVEDFKKSEEINQTDSQHNGKTLNEILKENSIENFFFLDIDGTLIASDDLFTFEYIPSLFLSEKHGQKLQVVDFNHSKSGDVFEIKHVLRPGAAQFIQFLANIPGNRIIFYSHGARERNETLLNEFNLRYNYKFSYSIYSREDEIIRGIYGKDIAFILEKELKKLSQFEKISPEDLYYYLQNSVLIDDTIHFWSEKQTYNVTKFEIKHCEDEFDWMKCNELFFLAGIIHESLQFDSKNSIPLSKLLNLTKDSLKEKIEILEISKLGLKQMQKYNPNLNFFEYENF